MSNYHEISLLLPKLEIVRFDSALRQAWNKDTAHPSVRNEWSQANPAEGQCVPTVLVIFDYFGGRFAKDKNLGHYWNILPDDTEHDFSREQLSDFQQPQITRVCTRRELLHGRRSIAARNADRYSLLKERVQVALRS